jgi:hypothetical protein
MLRESICVQGQSTFFRLLAWGADKGIATRPTISLKEPTRLF